MKVEVSVLNLKKKMGGKKRGRPKNDELTESIWEAFREMRNIKEVSRRLGMTEGRVAYHIKKKRNHIENK